MAARDRPVTLLARSEAEAQDLNAQRQHSRFLPGVPFPESLTVSSDVDGAVSTAELIVLAVPSEHFRPNLSLVSKAATITARHDLHSENLILSNRLSGQRLIELTADSKNTAIDGRDNA